MHTVKDIENFALCLIKNYGFTSNELSGFSCYIPDPSPMPIDDGFLIWNYSRTYGRFETQFQKFFSDARIYRLQQLNININDYNNKMENAILLFIDELKKIKISNNFTNSQSVFIEIGDGINNAPSKQSISNYAAFFTKHNYRTKRIKCILDDVTCLKEIEKIFTSNPIIDYISSLIVNNNKYFCIKTPSISCYENFLK